MDTQAASRYGRQLMLPEIGSEGQLRLRAAKVLIVGVGGLGSPVALYLAGAGVGSIGLIDADRVGVSNLHRQVLYETSQLGRPKVVCARERLQALNPDVDILIYEEMLCADNADKVIAGYDMVVDGTDNFAVRYMINDACVRLGKPYIYGAISGLQGQVAVLCKGQADYRTLFPDETAMCSLPSSGNGVVGVTPGIVGCVEASQVLQLVCSYGAPLIDRLWTIDLRDLSTAIVEISPLSPGLSTDSPSGLS